MWRKDILIITHDEIMIRALTPRVVGIIFPCTQFNNKTDCGVWGVQPRVLARCDVIVRANRNKGAVLLVVT